jgi:hypothetical protein
MTRAKKVLVVKDLAGNPVMTRAKKALVVKVPAEKAVK